MKQQTLIARIAVISGLALGAFALSALAGSWSAPIQQPPSGNVDAPINVGSSNQAKIGSLTIGTSTVQSSPLDVEGLGYIQALIVGKNTAKTFQYVDGNQAKGKVLESDAAGSASWVATSTLGLVSQITAGNNITISPTSGTGNVTINSDVPTGGIVFLTSVASLGTLTSNYTSYTMSSYGISANAKAALVNIHWLLGSCSNCGGFVTAKWPGGDETILNQWGGGNNTSPPQVGAQVWIPIIGGVIKLKEDTSQYGDPNAYSATIEGYQ